MPENNNSRSTGNKYMTDRQLHNTVITHKGLAALRDLRLMLGELTPHILEKIVLEALRAERDRRGLYPTTHINSLERR